MKVKEWRLLHSYRDSLRSQQRAIAGSCMPREEAADAMNPIWLRSLSCSGRCFSSKPETFNNS
ncbi:MAG: hypothetical protein AB1861_06460 [Cyanobacteriota bacterium]